MAVNRANDPLASSYGENEAEREKLKEAILECTRAEVVRTLHDILGGNNKPQNRGRIPLYEEVKRTKSCANHKQRPQTVKVVSGALPADRRRRPKTSHSQSKSSNDSPIVAPQPLPLESIDIPAHHTQIDRSSSNLLEKSSEIITEATGAPPKKFDSAFRHDGDQEPDEEAGTDSNRFSQPANKCDSTETAEVEPCGGDESFDGMPHAIPWRVRPTTATRLLHTSHSVLRNKPPKRRPLTTTALERRKPPSSTAASQRSKAQEISSRLLGPITLEPKRPSYDFVVPNSLAVNEWENELARNIINVFSNKARSEIKGEPPSEDDMAEALPPEISSTSLFSDGSAFHGNDFIVQEEDGDFQRISISRAGNDSTDAEFFAENPDTKETATMLVKAKKTVKQDLQSGTFRLKMIWFTGTGMVQANWESLNGEDIFRVILSCFAM